MVSTFILNQCSCRLPPPQHWAQQLPWAVVSLSSSTSFPLHLLPAALQTVPTSVSCPQPAFPTPSHSLGLHMPTLRSQSWSVIPCSSLPKPQTSVSVFNCLCSLWAKQPTVGSAAASYLLSHSTFSTSNVTECGLRDLTVFALAHWQEHCSKTNPWLLKAFQ